MLLGLVDALAVYVLMMLFLSESWGALAVSSAVVLAINWIYLRTGGLPAKYLAPGVLFLLVFQVFVVVLHAATSPSPTTATGTTAPRMTRSPPIQLTAQKRVHDSPAYKADRPRQGDNSFGLLVHRPATARSRSARHAGAP